MKIGMAIDNIHGKSSDKQVLEEFASKVRNAGHDVTTFGVGPNQIQSHMQSGFRCDLMLQIAGGMCIGTIADFITGCRRGYYKAKKAAIPFYTKGWTKYNPETWKATKAWDDNFSGSLAKKYFGKTLPSVWEMEKDVLTGWAHGKTVDAMATMFLKNIGGGTGSGTNNNTNATAGGGGSSIFDAIKQVLSDIDGYGIDMSLKGDTVSVRATNPKTARPLTPVERVNGSTNITDYDSSTPNVNGKAIDKFLVDRFGKIPIETEIKTDEAKILQIAQRGHGHTIDMKVILNQKFNVGQWVALTDNELGVTERPYYITKSNYDEEMVQSITLEPAPPSRYIEVQEVAEETEDTEGEETEEESE